MLSGFDIILFHEGLHQPDEPQKRFFGEGHVLIGQDKDVCAENKRIMWIPEGFAHGFLVLSYFAEFLYKTTDYWVPEYERTIIWNDSDLGIRWPLKEKPVLSGKDAEGIALKSAEIYG